MTAPSEYGFVAQSINVVDVDWSPGPQTALVNVSLVNNLAVPVSFSHSSVQCR